MASLSSPDDASLPSLQIAQQHYVDAVAAVRKAQEASSTRDGAASKFTVGQEIELAKQSTNATFRMTCALDAMLRRTGCTALETMTLEAFSQFNNASEELMTRIAKIQPANERKLISLSDAQVSQLLKIVRAPSSVPGSGSSITRGSVPENRPLQASGQEQKSLLVDAKPSSTRVSSGTKQEPPQQIAPMTESRSAAMRQVEPMVMSEGDEIRESVAKKPRLAETALTCRSVGIDAKVTCTSIGVQTIPLASSGLAFSNRNDENRSLVPSDEHVGQNSLGGAFQSAKDRYYSDARTKLGSGNPSTASGPANSNINNMSNHGGGNTGRKFVPPRKAGDNGSSDEPANKRMIKRALSGPDGKSSDNSMDADYPMVTQFFGSVDQLPERLHSIDLKMIELILAEVIDKSPAVAWDDIAGLGFAKKCVQEIVVWPMLRPDIFTGLRGPPKGLLLFGPPGTGKTLIGKAIASGCHARFFSISASSLMSKWVGEGERMVRTLFAVATALQPSVVFIDEIDSLLSQRSEGDMESSRRVKTEFLVQLDGAATCADDRILVIGATNRPQELDEAARRRLIKRLYIPLPDAAAREQLVRRLFRQQANDLSSTDYADIVARSDGYSGADLRALCAEAALGPIRSLPLEQMADIAAIRAEDVRPVDMSDFVAAFQQVRASVSQKDLEQYVEWNKTFGSFPIQHV